MYSAQATSASNASAAPHLGADMSQALSAMQACLNSNDLLQGQKTVSIVHNGSTYRLQATKLGKLILTK